MIASDYKVLIEPVSLFFWDKKGIFKDKYASRNNIFMNIGYNRNGTWFAKWSKNRHYHPISSQWGIRPLYIELISGTKIRSK